MARINAPGAPTMPASTHGDCGDQPRPRQGCSSSCSFFHRLPRLRPWTGSCPKLAAATAVRTASPCLPRLRFALPHLPTAASALPTATVSTVLHCYTATAAAGGKRLTNHPGGRIRRAIMGRGPPLRAPAPHWGLGGPKQRLCESTRVPDLSICWHACACAETRGLRLGPYTPASSS
jgi:hypothetical protein